MTVWIPNPTPRKHSPQQCDRCGSFCYPERPNGRCPETTCLFCGRRVCMSHGIGHGSCPICLVGMLEGWHHGERKCRYKGCTEPAVAFGKKGKYHVCRDHAAHQGLTTEPGEQWLRRWQEVDSNGS